MTKALSPAKNFSENVRSFLLGMRTGNETIRVALFHTGCFTVSPANKTAVKKLG
jgi:hypothetical protein